MIKSNFKAYSKLFNSSDSDCIESSRAKNSGGYPVIKFKGANRLLHRFIFCELNNLDVLDSHDFVVMHTCDNPSCINPNHLVAGTHADNCNDKVNKNRQAKGSMIGISKLTENQVFSIKHFLSIGFSGAELAEKYGVSHMCISRIKRWKTWTHVNYCGGGE